MRLLFFLLVPVFCFSQTIVLTDSDIAAFYGAQGHGKNTTGGRAQSVYRVTNLNDSGLGSLREAVSVDNRIVTFTVGGTINLSSQLTIAGNNITIAGQTAPGDGIATYQRGIQVNGENIIMRHIRSRPGDAASGTDDDCIRVRTVGGSGTYSGYMFDHISMSWGDDENFAVETGISGNTTVFDLTLSNSIISEDFGAGNAILYGKNIYNVSVINNLFANSSSRNLTATVADSNTEYEFVNNFVYNYAEGTDPNLRQELDIVGNVYEDGPSTQSLGTIRLEVCNPGNCPPSGDTNAVGTQIYDNDNTWNGGAATFTAAGGLNINDYRVGSSVAGSTYVARSSSTVEQYMIDNVGARQGVSGRDALDAHMIADMQDGSTGSFPDNEAGTIGLPTLSSGTPYPDADSDGLSDAYEAANGGNITQSDRPVTATLTDGTIIDQSGVTAGIRYTHMDIFLGELAGDWVAPSSPDPSPDPSPIAKGSNRIKGSGGSLKLIIGN